MTDSSAPIDAEVGGSEANLGRERRAAASAAPVARRRGWTDRLVQGWFGGISRESPGEAEFRLAQQCFWSGMQLLESGRYAAAMLLLGDAWRWVDLAGADLTGSDEVEPGDGEPTAPPRRSPREFSAILAELPTDDAAAEDSAQASVARHRDVLGCPDRRRVFELDRRQAKALASALASVVASRLAPVEGRLVLPPSPVASWTKRALLAVLALAILGWLVGPAIVDMLRGPNLALGATAFTSHSDPAFDVPPSRVVDGDRKNLGFNTGNHHVPRLEIDLGAVKSIREVVIYNRADCCEDAAVPLMLEVGRERDRYQEVATRHEPFDVWSVDVGKMEVRWLRLTVVRSSTFHLAEVEVY